MIYFRDQNSSGIPWNRLGNWLTQRLIQQGTGDWFSDSFWRMPKWKDIAKNAAQEILLPTKEADEYMEAAINPEDKWIVVQVRWGNHIPGDCLHFPTLARTFIELIDLMRSQWKDYKIYLASDVLDEVLPFFKKYEPHTQVTLWPNINYPCIADYWMMTRADKLICSNSSFSWAASLINKKCDLFVRPDEADRLVVFEPWNSWPCVKLRENLGEQNKNSFKEQRQ